MRAFEVVKKKRRKNKTKPVRSGDTIKMRPHQLNVFTKYKDYRYVSIEQPPGSGKSALSQFIFADEMHNNPDLKLVIAIPQNIIAPNYAKHTFLEYASNKKIEWRVRLKNNLCRSKTKDVVSKIITFINSTPESADLSDRVMICSHMGLAVAFKRDPHLDFTNTYLVIDESHHCMIAEDNEADYEISNGLGKVVKYHLGQNASGSGLWLTTATFFRGDCLSVLSEEIADMFEVSHMPLDEHFCNLNIESYSYDFIPYVGEYPRDEIQREFKGKLLKTIIYVPHVGRLWSDRNKAKTVSVLADIIHKEKPNARILDLINSDDSPLNGDLNTGNREDRKEYLMKHPSKVDVVLAVRILDEGTDWVYAQQVLDLAPSSSLRVSCQRFGRLLRDAPNKSHIYYKVFFPYNYNAKNADESRESLDRYFTTKSLAFIQHDNIVPVHTPTQPSGSRHRREVCHRRYFHDTVPDINKRASILTDVQLAISQLVAKKEQQGEQITVQEGRGCIRKALRRRVHAHQDEIVSEIERQLHRASFPTFNADPGISLDAIQWQRIADDTVGIFVSGTQEGQAWKKIRKILGIRHKLEKEHIALMRKAHICSNRKWRIYHRNHKLQNEGYYLDPCQAFGKSEGEFYDQLRESKKTNEDCFNLMREIGVKNYSEWWAYYEENNLREKGYRKNPWASMGISQKEFFDKLLNRMSYKTEKEHLALMKKECLLLTTEWKMYYEENNLGEEQYYRSPWTVFKKSAKEFFKPIRNTKTEKEHLDLMKTKKLFTPKVWVEHYKKNSLKEKGYWKKPWLVAKKNATQYFAPFQQKRKSEAEHLKLMKRKKLLSAEKWIAYYKKHKLGDEGYYRTPWDSFKKTVNELLAPIR